MADILIDWSEEIRPLVDQYLHVIELQKNTVTNLIMLHSILFVDLAQVIQVVAGCELSTGAIYSMCNSVCTNGELERVNEIEKANVLRWVYTFREFSLNKSH